MTAATRTAPRPLRDEGYFIGPDGGILRVTSSHIAAVVADPERFGLTREEIERAHEDAGEPIGSEGRAREALLRRVLDAGWIRARRHANRGWSVEASWWGPDVEARVAGWAARLRRGHEGRVEADRSVEVRVRGLVDGVVRVVEFREFR